MDDRLQEDSVEQHILSKCLTDEKFLAEAISRLEEKHFGNPHAGGIFRAIKSLYVESTAVNILSVKHLITNKETLDYLENVNSVVPVYNPESLCDLTIDLYRIRELYNFSYGIIHEIETEPVTGIDLINSFQEKVLILTGEKKGESFLTFSDELENTWNNIERLRTGEITTVGLSTGILDLDTKTTGLRKGELWVIGGRPSHGKTELALNIISHNAFRKSSTCAMFSLEMPAEQLQLRMMSEISGIPLWKFRTGNLTDKDVTEFTKIKDKIKETKLLLFKEPHVKPSELFAKTKQAKLLYPDLSLIVVDYLQLMTPEGGENSRNDEVGKMSRTLKILAMDLDIPIIAISQLSRACDSRRNKRPMLSDLRESGSIEQDADVVLFCYRPYMYTKKKEHEKLMEIVVAKQRNGPQARFLVTNDVEIQKIYQTGDEFYEDFDFTEETITDFEREE
jgi:replicative DNA helicase